MTAEVTTNEIIVTCQEKALHFNFTDVFGGGQDLESLSNFSLSRKRNFCNIKELLAEVIQHVMSRSVTTGASFLKIHYEMAQDEHDFQEDELTREILAIFTPEVKKIISDHVEEVYSADLDTTSKTTSAKNVELQFTDAHAKAIIKASMAMKLVIPLITNFMNFKSYRKVEELFLNCFLPILEMFGEDGMQLHNKLFKLVESRVRATQYSDTVIWSYLENIATDMTTLVNQLTRKIVLDIIPKLEHERNMISFLHTAVKNQIRYAFTQKFPISYKPITPNSEENEESNPFDRLEAQFQHDEGIGIITELNITNIIERYEEKVGVITQEELDYYNEHVSINNVQTNLLFLYFARVAGRYDRLNAANKLQYMKLLILMVKSLRRADFPLIAQYMIATPMGENPKRRQVPTKRFIVNFIESKDHRDLHEGHYSAISQRFADSKILLRLITSLARTVFKPIHPYEATLEGVDPEELPETMDPQVEAIGAEILRFINMIA